MAKVDPPDRKAEPPADSVCSGLSVLDCSWGMAGPLVGMMLADFGADVVKVEPPGGDPYRKMAGAVQWHRGKRSVVLDLKDPRHQAEAQRLAAHADILIESFRPGVADRLALGYAALRERNPRLIYCSISGFGSRGPWSKLKAYEGVVLARGGFLAATNAGWRTPGPIYLVLNQASAGAANYALHGIFAALRLRRSTGIGYRVETSLLQGALAFQIRTAYQWKDQSDVPQREIADDANDPLCNIAGYRICRCSDGAWLQLGVFQPDMFHRLLVAVGMREESKDPRFANAPQFQTDEDRKYIIRRLDEQLAVKPFAHWARAFEEHDVAYSAQNTTQEAMDDPQVRHVGMVVPVNDPVHGETEQVGPPFELLDGGWRVRGGSPRAGEHTEAVLADGAARAVRQEHSDDPSSSAPMLHGIKVIEAATYVAAPTATGYLVDYGADVLRIEPPGGDPQNNWGDVNTRPNRGKRSMRIDLKDPRGQKLLHRLVADADIFLHNFRPGVAERLGIDYATLSRVNPRLIYCHAASYGSTGPYSKRPAFDPVVSALMGGEMAQAGTGNPPTIHFTSDLGAGVTTTTALLTGLYQRDRTGHGQHIESRMINAAAYLHSDDFIRFEGKAPRRLADGGQHGIHALYRIYEAAEGWVFLAAVTDAEWQALCEATGNQRWLADPRYATAESRSAHDEALGKSLAAMFRNRAASDWERALTVVDVACVCAHEEFGRLLFEHEHMREAVGFTSGFHPTWGEFMQAGPLVRLGGVPGVSRLRTSVSGEDTDEVLRALGYRGDDAKRLREAQVVS